MKDNSWYITEFDRLSYEQEVREFPWAHALLSKVAEREREETLENVVKDWDRLIEDFEGKAKFAISEMKRYREDYSEELNKSKEDK